MSNVVFPLGFPLLALNQVHVYINKFNPFKIGIMDVSFICLLSFRLFFSTYDYPFVRKILL